jgi:transposase
MIKFPRELKVLLFTAPVDMRRGFDRLAEFVRASHYDPVNGSLYVFFSRSRDRIKALYWDRDGYCQWYKRLEAGTFKIRSISGVEEITGVDLRLLLSGMELSRIKLRKEVEKLRHHLVQAKR